MFARSLKRPFVRLLSTGLILCLACSEPTLRPPAAPLGGLRVGHPPRWSRGATGASPADGLGSPGLPRMEKGVGSPALKVQQAKDSPPLLEELRRAGLEEPPPSPGEIGMVQKLLTATLQAAWKTLGSPSQLTVDYLENQRAYRYPGEDTQLVEWDIGFLSLPRRDGKIVTASFTINPAWVNELVAMRRSGVLEQEVGSSPSGGAPLTFGQALVQALVAHPMALMVNPPHPSITLEDAWHHPTPFLTPMTLVVELVHMRLIAQDTAPQAVSLQDWQKQLSDLRTSLRSFLRSSDMSWDQFVRESYGIVTRLHQPISPSRRPAQGGVQTPEDDEAAKAPEALGFDPAGAAHDKELREALLWVLEPRAFAAGFDSRAEIRVPRSFKRVGPGSLNR